MTYEERVLYHEGREKLAALRAELESGDPSGSISRAQALEIIGLLEFFAERVSPERWDRALEAIAEEAARRADILAARRN
jgi:hypothetical protein